MPGGPIATSPRMRVFSPTHEAAILRTLTPPPIFLTNQHRGPPSKASARSPCQIYPSPPNGNPAPGPSVKLPLPPTNALGNVLNGANTAGLFMIIRVLFLIAAPGLRYTRWSVIAVFSPGPAPWRISVESPSHSSSILPHLGGTRPRYVEQFQGRRRKGQSSIAEAVVFYCSQSNRAP